MVQIAACLERWPAPRIERRVSRPARPARTIRPTGHYPSDLIWSGNRWRCPACCSSFSALPRHACPGESVVFKKILSKDMGHQLWSARCDDGSILMFCRRCGHYSANRAVDLLKRCIPPPLGATNVVKRLSKGLHPWKRMSLSKPWPVRIQVPLAAPCAAIDLDHLACSYMPRIAPSNETLQAMPARVIELDDADCDDSERPPSSA